MIALNVLIKNSSIKQHLNFYKATESWRGVNQGPDPFLIMYVHYPLRSAAEFLRSAFVSGVEKFQRLFRFILSASILNSVYQCYLPESINDKFEYFE